MPATMHPRPRFRPGTPLARAWLCAMVAVLLLQAAVPLLATWAARSRGVALVEVCSVYGVRTVAVDAPGEKAPAYVASDSPCALASLLGPWAPVPVAALPPLPAPRFAANIGHEPGAPPPPDASQRWLTWRLHAPPHTA